MGFTASPVRPDPRGRRGYVRREWGDEVPEWFEEYVVGRVVDTTRNVGGPDA